MWVWRRVMAKKAIAAFALLFALQAIAAPGLCAIHDRISTSTETSDHVTRHGTRRVERAAVSPRLDVHGAGQSQHDDADLDHCDVPTLLPADTAVPAPGELSIIVDLALAWHQATLRPLSSGIPVPAGWARCAPPRSQSSPLDIAPRLRI